MILSPCVVPVEKVTTRLKTGLCPGLGNKKEVTSIQVMRKGVVFEKPEFESCEIKRIYSI